MNKKSQLILFTVILILVVLGTSFLVCAEGTGQSYQAILANGVFRVLSYNTRHNSFEWGLNKLEKNRRVNENYIVPSYYITHYDLDVYKIDNFQVVVFNKDAESGKYIFYLHGGAFAAQPIVFHYDFLKKLSEEIDCTIVMPIYPKAPNYTFETTIPMVVNTYTDLLTRVDSQNITVMGDSAGAAMSLSVCQYFKTQNIPQPADIIVFSPCMDGKFDNPDIAEYQSRDFMLAQKMLIVKISSYAGSEENLENYLVSPIYGDFNGLAPITLFMGTEEILLPDVRLFVNMAKEQEIDLNYYEYEHMLHVFPLFPIPEAVEVRGMVKDIILDK